MLLVIRVIVTNFGIPLLRTGLMHSATTHVAFFHDARLVEIPKLRIRWLTDGVDGQRRLTGEEMELRGYMNFQ